MSYEKDKKDFVARVIPETPTLKNEPIAQTGIQRLWGEFKLGHLKRRAFEEQLKVLLDTKHQLLQDRTSEIILAYRYQATAARKAFIKEADEYLNYIIDQINIKIADNKQLAIKKAVENYADLMLGIRPDLTPELINKIQQSAELLLDRTINEVLTSYSDIEKDTKEYYPDKRTP